MVTRPVFIKINFSRLNKFDIINIILFFSACLMFFYVIISMVSINQNYDLKQLSKSRQVRSLEKLEFIKRPWREYGQILAAKKLFVLSAGIKPPANGPFLGLEGVVEAYDLQLLGIISGTQGTQALITNTKSGQSYYCLGGEQIGQFIVKEVQQNMVILEKDGQEIILRL